MPLARPLRNAGRIKMTNLLSGLSIFLLTALGRAQTPAPDRLWVASGHTDVPYAVAYSPDGNLLASGSLDNTLKLWRMSDGALLRTLVGHANWISAVDFSPDGSKVVSGSYDRTIKVWRVSDGVLLNTLYGHGNYVFHVAFSPDGTMIGSASADTTARLWRAADGAALQTLPCVNWVYTAVFSPDSATLLTSDVSYNIWLWHI